MVAGVTQLTLCLRRTTGQGQFWYSFLHEIVLAFPSAKTNSYHKCKHTDQFFLWLQLTEASPIHQNLSRMMSFACLIYSLLFL